MGDKQNISSLNSPKFLILLGPQGSGKGTQASYLIDKFHPQYLATGEIFREIANQNNPLGKQIATYLNSGDLVPDDIMITVFEKKLKSLDISQGILFDGMPRTLNQARLLDKLLTDLNYPLPKVIYLKITRQTAINRLINRRICIKCQSPYLPDDQSYKQSVCQKCGGKVISRTDDNFETIKNRLNQYYAETEPEIDYYRKQHRLIEIDGEPPIDKVTQKIMAQLEKI